MIHTPQISWCFIKQKIVKKEKSEQWHDPGTVTGRDGKEILVKHRPTYVRVHPFRITHRDGSRTAATSKMKLEAVNYYHKVLHSGYCSSPRSASDSCY